jgi:hypothetical protein
LSLASVVFEALRRLPHTVRFEAHLVRCDWFLTLYPALYEQVPEIGIPHILGLAPLPPFNPSCARPICELG